MANDAINKVLLDLANLRGTLQAQIMKLPVPDPARKTLQSMDQTAAKLESDIRSKLPNIPGF
jgi:hypothetical protein